MKIGGQKQRGPAYAIRILRDLEPKLELKSYVTAAIAAADQLKVGHGHGPLQSFLRAME